MIIAFYSFKGGVGRSMALANVSVLLSRAGFRVLVVDADLEAPGLESYLAFPDAGETASSRASAQGNAIKRVKDKDGFIDLICQYRNRVDPPSGHEPWPEDLDVFPNLLDYICQLDGFGLRGRRPGPLQMITAGNRSDLASYAARVNQFDWKSFEEYAAGSVFFEWLRRELNKVADFVFIDSRTGVTEMGGVCTRNLADLVVAVCAPNDQNLDGTQRVVSEFLLPELQEQREGIARRFCPPGEQPNKSIQRPLDIFVLPSRVDQFTAGSLYDEFARRLETEILQNNTDNCVTGQPGRPELKVLIETPVPYVPYRAFRERLAVPPPMGYGATSYPYEPDPMTKAYHDLADEILSWGLRHAAAAESQSESQSESVGPVNFVIAAAPEDLDWAELLREGLSCWDEARVSIGVFESDASKPLSARLRSVFGDPTLPAPLIVLINPRVDHPMPRWGTANVGLRYASAGIFRDRSVVEVAIKHRGTMPGRLSWEKPEELLALVEAINTRFVGGSPETLKLDSKVDQETQRKNNADDNLADDAAVLATLEYVKKSSLDWENTTGSARKWWIAFEEENKNRLRSVLALARKLESRKANITEFFLAYVYSNVDDINANLAYLDYTRLKKEEERKKKEAASRLLQSSGRDSGQADVSGPTS